METVLPYVKMYISLGSYRSMIFVNKSSNAILSSMKGQLMLVKLLRYAGYMGPFVDKYISKLGFRETIDLFIESIEPPTNRYQEYNLVYNTIKRIKIDKRLKYLNLF